MEDTLVDRIEHGMTTAEDARIVARIIARQAVYEMALREIAAYGTGASAMLAARVLAGDPDTYLFN